MVAAVVGKPSMINSPGVNKPIKTAAAATLSAYRRKSLPFSSRFRNKKSETRNAGMNQLQP